MVTTINKLTNMPIEQEINKEFFLENLPYLRLKVVFC